MTENINRGDGALQIAKAPLPEAYREARAALEKCETVDECKGWADRALALASYARQSRDTTLMAFAQRIQLRAVARMGELLKEFDGRQGQNLPDAKSGDAPTFSQREAAEAAGLSKDQQVQAVRIASVPVAEREALIESDDPPTITALAGLGTKRRPLVKPDPLADPWADWVFAIGALREIPSCGLAALVQHRELPSARLLADARAARVNLDTWIKLLEEDVHADGKGLDRTRAA